MVEIMKPYEVLTSEKNLGRSEVVIKGIPYAIFTEYSEHGIIVAGNIGYYVDVSENPKAGVLPFSFNHDERHYALRAASTLSLLSQRSKEIKLEGTLYNENYQSHRIFIEEPFGISGVVRGYHLNVSRIRD